MNSHVSHLRQAFRPFLYSQPELRAHDVAISSHYATHHDLSTRLAQSIHDYSIIDALHDYLEGKTPIGFMGGHKTARGSPEYQSVVKLARRLARAGFLIVTGGGMGTMEAANLGGYLADKTDAQVEQALKIIATSGGWDEAKEWANPQPALNVIAALGEVTHMPSIGIPTFRYTQEPPNAFATWHAKFFSNALREDGSAATPMLHSSNTPSPPWLPPRLISAQSPCYLHWWYRLWARWSWYSPRDLPGRLPQ